MKKVLLLLVLVLLGGHWLIAQNYSNTRCKTMLDEQARARLNSVEPRIQQQISALRATDQGPENLITIPVKFYAVRQSDGTGGPTFSMLSVLSFLNSKFSGTGFYFAQCGQTSNISNSVLYDFNTNQEGLLRKSGYTPGVVNIYFTNTITHNGEELEGYAYMPESSVHDVVVLEYSAATGATAAHEMGHYFGLYHTHGAYDCGPKTEELVNGCNSAYTGDKVTDTNADPCLEGVFCSGSLLNNCAYNNTILTDNNGDVYNPMVENLMSYAPASCQMSFTPLQKARMVAIYQIFRSYLACPGTSANCNPPLVAFASEITDRSAKITWGTVSGALHYEIELQTGNDPWVSVQAGPSTGANFIYLQDLSQSTQYKCRVRTGCTYGVSDWKESSFTTLAPCNTPGNLSTTLIGTDYVQFSWNPVPGAQSYSVDVRHVGSTYWYKGFTTTSSTYFFPTTSSYYIEDNRGLASSTASCSASVPRSPSSIALALAMSSVRAGPDMPSPRSR